MTTSPISSSNMIKLSGHESKCIRYCTVNCVITFLLYIQLLKENATFKLHFVLIVLPCKQQNVTYIRFLNYMHLPLKRTLTCHRILYGHMVGMVRCDWPFTVGYIIIIVVHWMCFTFVQYKDLVKSTVNRPERCMSVLWSLGQVGFTSITAGLRGL